MIERAPGSPTTPPAARPHQRLRQPTHLAGRVAGRIALLPLLGAALLAAWFDAGRHGTAAEGLAFPAPAGTRWSIAAGYNTATHLASDPYAIDVVRDDAETTGTPVLAPADGALSISTDCLTIRDAARVAILLCHVLPQPGLRSGQRVVRGQLIGSVAPPGAAGNNGLAHIHIAAHYSADGRGFGATIPLAGVYALEAVQLPATLEANAYSGVTFASSNVEQPAPALTVTAAPAKATATPKAAATPTPQAGTRESVLGLKPSGVSLAVVLAASTPNDLVTAARAVGATRPCTFSSTVGGGWVTYIDGAPPSVNERWRAAYPIALPAPTTLYFACA